MTPSRPAAGAPRGVERLEIAAGFCSDPGPRPDNQDYVAVFTGTATQRARFGVIAAVADGVGGSKGGRVAAELAVRSLIDGILGQNEMLGMRRVTARALEAVNSWVNTLGRTDAALDGMACTLTCVVVRGRAVHVVHVGDSRLYRLRGDRLDLLTTDHVYTEPAMRNVLRRAVGASDGLQIDYLQDAARVHDRYLLCSDGLHGVVGERGLREELGRRASPDETARALVDAALSARTGDNVSAVVLDVLDLPPANEPDLALAIDALPILPAPAGGTVVDGFRLDIMLSDGRYSRVFRAHDTVGDRAVIAKFPKPITGGDRVLRGALLRETWISGRVRSPYVGEVVEIAPERQSRLYLVMPFYDGETLEQRIARSPRVTLSEGLGLAIRLARAVAALHRAGIIHRDVKPDNVILENMGDGAEPGLKLIDLGVARVPRMDDFTLEHAPGTPSYMAPELFAGQDGDAASDQFALGVTIYRLFANAYPYGEVEAFSRPRFTKPVPLGVRRADLPAWLCRAVDRAVSPSPTDRFGDVLELAFDLEHGSARAGPAPPTRVPLHDRDPVVFWKVVAGLLALSLLLSWAFDWGGHRPAPAPSSDHGRAGRALRP